MNSEVWTWGESNYELYEPRMNQYKKFGIGGFVVACILTPGTNWMLIPIKMLVKRNLGWFYR